MKEEDENQEGWVSVRGVPRKGAKNGQEGHEVDDGGRRGWGSPPALSSSPF